MYQEQQQQRPLLNSILCRILAIITALVITLGVIILIIYFIFRPRVPEFQINSASVNSLIISGNNRLNASWEIQLLVKNPNKKLDVSYNHVAVSVNFGENRKTFQQLANVGVPPFYQQKKTKTLLKYNLQVSNLLVDNVLASRIAAERYGGSVNFFVGFDAITKRKGLFQPKDSLLKVSCAPLKFVLSPNKATGALLSPVKCV